MIGHLANLADKQLILSFAPKTLYYSVLKRIGEFFPGPSRVGAPSCPVDQCCLTSTHFSLAE